MVRLELAPLSPAEAAHEARVVARIRAELEAAGGWLPFSRYMELALYAPGLGYYAAGAHKLGPGGDFATAPELSPVFGRCVATQAGEVLDALGGGEILELGAGTGALAAEVLGELERQRRLPARYRILEVAADLRERQQTRLAALPAVLRERVEWLDAPPAEPFRGLLLANEVLDALPVERFRVGADGVLALGVGLGADGRFGWATRAADPPLAAAVAAVEADLGRRLPEGYVGEVGLAVEPWLATVLAPLAAGVALLFDYGLPRAAYYAPDRGGGWLACFHRHRRHDDPFVNVGLQDLTAWVDFTRVAGAGLAAGFEVTGFTTQAHFLLATGFDAHLAALAAGRDAGAAALLAQRASRLVLPGEMGERFKCLALGRATPVALRGFALRDFTATL